MANPIFSMSSAYGERAETLLREVCELEQQAEASEKDAQTAEEQALATVNKVVQFATDSNLQLFRPDILDAPIEGKKDAETRLGLIEATTYWYDGSASRVAINELINLRGKALFQKFEALTHHQQAAELRAKAEKIKDEVQALAHAQEEELGVSSASQEEKEIMTEVELRKEPLPLDTPPISVLMGLLQTAEEQSALSQEDIHREFALYFEQEAANLKKKAESASANEPLIGEKVHEWIDYVQKIRRIEDTYAVLKYPVLQTEGYSKPKSAEKVEANKTMVRRLVEGYKEGQGETIQAVIENLIEYRSRQIELAWEIKALRKEAQEANQTAKLFKEVAQEEYKRADQATQGWRNLKFNWEKRLIAAGELLSVMDSPEASLLLNRIAAEMETKGESLSEAQKSLLAEIKELLPHPVEDIGDRAKYLFIGALGAFREERAPKTPEASSL